MFDDPDFVKGLMEELNVDPESSEAKEMLQGIQKDKKQSPGDGSGKMDEEKK